MVIDLNRGILPVFVAQPGSPAKLLDFCGTGFLIANGLLITCWHVVKPELPNGQRYCVAVNEGTTYSVFFLQNVQQDLNGSDLATATVHLDASIGLTLARDDVILGGAVWTYGYPLTDVKSLPEGDLHFRVNPRFMRGHVMRHFNYDHAEYGNVPSYELNIPAPQGISGAPLVKNDMLEVVGVVYGNNDVATIEEFAHIDEKTGKRQPELQRIVSFGLANHLAKSSKTKRRCDTRLDSGGISFPTPRLT
jgi:hypothetical protein